MAAMFCRYELHIVWNFGPETIVLSDPVREDEAIEEAAESYRRRRDEIARASSGDRFPTKASVGLYDFHAEETA